MHRSQLPIPELCCADWEQMSGDEQRRFCTECEKNVVNLSALTEGEALYFLHQTDNPCIRYTYDEDGQVYFIPRQLRRQRQGLKRLLAAAAAVPLTLGIGLAVYEPPEPTLPVCAGVEASGLRGAGQLRAFAVDDEGKILVRDDDGCVDYFEVVMPLGGAVGGLGDFIHIPAPLPKEFFLTPEEREVADGLVEVRDDT